MRIYPNIPLVFTDSEEDHDAELMLYWITKGADSGKDTGIRVLMTICSSCQRPLKLYAHYNTVPFTF